MYLSHSLGQNLVPIQLRRFSLDFRGSLCRQPIVLAIGPQSVGEAEV